MTSVPDLGVLTGLTTLEQCVDPDTWWTEQHAITRALADHLATLSAEHWLTILDAADVWCAPVLTLPEIVEHDGFRALDIAQQTERPDADGGSPVAIQTIRTLV